MRRFLGATASVALFGLGMAVLTASASLLMPATNPVSDAAPRFQSSMLAGTLLAALLLGLSEVAARWLWGPARGWYAAWVVAGAAFLFLGAPLVVGALEGVALSREYPAASALARRTLGFGLGLGALYLALGIASVALAWRRWRPRLKSGRFDSPPRRG